MNIFTGLKGQALRNVAKPAARQVWSRGMKTIPMHEIREFYARNNPDGHWFDADSMRFFKTKLPENGYELSCGGVYFITRETNPSGVSAYTVRRQLPNADIETVGDFHRYKTAAAAARAAINQIEILGAAA